MKRAKWSLLSVVHIAAAFLMASLIFSCTAAAQSRVTIGTGSVHYAGEYQVPINKSQILRVDAAFTDLMVGNPKIADVLPLTDRMIYILGKGLGSTTLSIYGPEKTLLAILDLQVSYDVEELKRRFFELMPRETIEVRGIKDSLILSGTVSSSVALTKVLSVAERFAPKKVTNLLRVKGSQQVMLAVRFAEVKRTVIKELGFNNSFALNIGAGTISILTGASSATAFGSVAAGLTAHNATLNATLNALEHEGLVKTLAEPNLITTSGEMANFLAGGEFPVPVAQATNTGGTTITVEFKEFGVSLAFTPTVLEDGLINLEVAPEVSSIDTTNAVTVSGFSVPGISTRRAKTTVELGDGQSFAIAGLLQSDFTDQVDAFPELGRLPVLGALFRSADYRRDETELVIIVTPYLVKPARPGDLRAPTDDFVPPSDADFFLKGKITGTKPASGTQGGGLDGNVGHIIK